MKTMCSTNMPYALEAFRTLGEARVVEGRSISAADVKEADLLAIRSTTRVDRQLLEGSRVRFVGTATIGIDHMDTDYLESAGIRWCHAPGCNANSVSEYVAAALLRLANRHGFALRGKTIGVVGVGNVGRRIVEKARVLGMNALPNDPPRQRAEGEGDFASLEAVLARADIVTLHVPLTAEGPDRTFHMADEAFFARMKPGALFFNCARGGTTDTGALLAALERGTVRHAVIDTWEGEPDFSTDLLARCDIGTPHIAGHSFEGRVTGTVMVYQAACRFLGVPPSWTPDALLPAPDVPEIVLDAGGLTEERALWEIVRRVYDIEADDRRMRESAVADAAARRRNFDLLRKNYPMRREFRYTRVALKNASTELAGRLAGLGFRVDLVSIPAGPT
jgi:erythronate-4-phosphate dehydrogenase